MSTANTPQHLVGQNPDILEGNPDGMTVREGRVRQTGHQPGVPNDVADPHPSDEEHPYRHRRPGGAVPPKHDLGANDSIHSGQPKKKPDTVEVRDDLPKGAG